MTIKTFFGFRNGELITIIHTTEENEDYAVDCDYYITDPQEVVKQIKLWKAKTL